MNVIKTPSPLMLTGNDIPLHINTQNDEFSAIGAVAIGRLAVSSQPLPGPYIRFVWRNGDRDLRFRFVASPDNSGLQIPVGLPTVAEFREAFRDALKANPLIDEDFDITIGASNIFFTARKKGNLGNITKLEGDDFTFTAEQEGIDIAFKTNYRILLDIEAARKPDASFKRLRMEQKPVENLVQFNLGKALYRSVSTPVYPVLGSSAFVSANNMLIKYLYKYYAQSGLPISAGKSIGSGLLYALDGGLAEYAQMDFQAKLTAKEFLTNRRSSLMNLSDELFLYFFNSVADYLLAFAKINFFDGTDEESDFLELDPAQASSLYILPFRFALIQPLLPTGKNLSDVASVEIRVSDGSVDVTETFTVYQDRVPPVVKNLFEFRNAFGCYELLYTTGVSATKAEFEQQIAIAENDEQRVTNKRNARKLTINSGFANRDKMEAIFEMLASEEVYLHLNNKKYPVVLSVDNADLYDTHSGRINELNIQVEFPKERFYGRI